MDPSKKAQLDELLTYGVEALDLTPTQYNDAVQKYHAVGAWLSKPGSILAAVNPSIYPHGSIALGTATKPVGQSEFDLDLVCQLRVGAETSPTILKRAVGQRLRESAVYQERLEEKNRCWRIVYAGEFHLDILPGRPDPRFATGTALLIPDKKLVRWKETDPKGYAAWFAERSRLSSLLKNGLRADVQAPPPAPHTSTKTPLQLAVQILKRHRDLCMGGDEDAPISIIITTLAGKAYVGQQSIYETLKHLITHMPAFIEADTAGNPFVGNPVNPLENFADKWREEPTKREKFFEWLLRANSDLDQLSGAILPDVANALIPFVGGRASSEAVRRYGTRIDHLRASGLRAVAATGMLDAGSVNARSIPRQTFFGRDS